MDQTCAERPLLPLLLCCILVLMVFSTQVAAALKSKVYDRLKYTVVGCCNEVLTFMAINLERRMPVPPGFTKIPGLAVDAPMCMWPYFVWKHSPITASLVQFCCIKYSCRSAEIPFFISWTGFVFSDLEPTALEQFEGGPCAVIAPVQVQPNYV